MRIGIIAAGIILTLWYEVCGEGACGPLRAQGTELRAQSIGQLIYLGSRLGELASLGSDSGLPISEIRFAKNGAQGVERRAQGTELRAQSIGQRVADSIVAVDPDKVHLEAAIDPAVIIIDVRMKMEYRRGHIEKAVHLPKKKDLMEFVEATNLSRPLYLYCTTETRSRQAAKILVEAGFERVFVIEGGFNKWKAYGLPEGKGTGRRAQGSGHLVLSDLSGKFVHNQYIQRP